MTALALYCLRLCSWLGFAVLLMTGLYGLLGALWMLLERGRR